MLIDAHIHYAYPAEAKKILKACTLTGAETCCLQSQIMRRSINQNMDTLYAKVKCDGKIYINMALNAYFYEHHELMNEMPKYIERMLDCGFDGVKMIEGKPTDHKAFPIPDFDSPLYDATFAYLENNQIPITWHVNDPEEFWDEEKVPFWAKRNGWFYGDGTFVNNEDQYDQIDRLLQKHPKLVITFAHFYFLSNDLKRLGAMFDKYPNIAVDITPGIELFTNMSDNIEEARAFFNQYSERILYGTDISIDLGEIDQLNIVDAKTRHDLCHDFLTKERFTLKGDEKGLLGKDDLDLNGLALSENKVSQIESGNFLKRYHEIKPLKMDKIKEEIALHREMLIKSNRDTSYLDKISLELFKEH